MFTEMSDDEQQMSPDVLDPNIGAMEGGSADQVISGQGTSATKQSDIEGTYCGTMISGNYM